MSTRSSITAKCADGKFRSIYCHYDGYPSGVGQTLLEHYDHLTKIEALLALGPISSLAADYIRPPGHSYDEKLSGYTVAYHRDRGDEWDDNCIGIGSNATEARNNGPTNQEYNYVWKDGVWRVNGKILKYPKSK